MSQSQSRSDEQSQPGPRAALRPYESRPFELEDPGEPGRVIRGVIDAPLGAQASGVPLPIVVVFHGFKGFFRWGFYPYLAERIVAAGLPVVRFNFSGSGVGADLEDFTDDAGFEHNTAGRELQDAARVLDFLAASPLDWLDASRIGLVGHSMGGAVAFLTAAARPESVRAVVAWAPVASFDRFDEAQKRELRARGWLGIPNARTGQLHKIGVDWLDDLECHGAERDPLRACAELRAPTLILHGTADANVPLEEARRLERALPPGLGRLEVLPESGHTFEAKHPLEIVPQALGHVVDRTLEHLISTLRHAAEAR